MEVRSSVVDVPVRLEGSEMRGLSSDEGKRRAGISENDSMIASAGEEESGCGIGEKGTNRRNRDMLLILVYVVARMYEQGKHSEARGTSLLQFAGVPKLL